MNIRVKGSLLAIAIAVAMGCGGGGGGTSGSVVAGPRVGFFVTSSSTGAFSHVWVNVKQVNLVGPSGKVSLFQSTTGKPVDLASLNQAGQKVFAVLGVNPVPISTYSSVEVTVDKSVTVVPTGSATGSQDDLAGSTGTTKTISFSTTATGSKDVVANFDLSKWTVSGSQITGSAQDDNGSEVSGGTQEPQEFQGAVSNLSGASPTLAFDITEESATTHVVTDSTTVIANSDGSANPVIANGSVVDIHGTLDTTTKALKAATIMVMVGNHVSPNHADGTIASTGANSFVLNVNHCEGQIPSSATMNVTVTATTAFLDANGITITSAQFFTAAVAGTRVEAAGTYDLPSNTLAATSVSIHQDHQNGGGGGGGNNSDHEVQIKGPVTVVNAANGTLTMTVQEFEGAQLTQGSALNVVTTATTTFNGVTLATLATGTAIEVHGTYSGTTLTAVSVGLAN